MSENTTAQVITEKDVKQAFMKEMESYARGLSARINGLTFFGFNPYSQSDTTKRDKVAALIRELHNQEPSFFAVAAPFDFGSSDSPSSTSFKLNSDIIDLPITVDMTKTTIANIVNEARHPDSPMSENKNRASNIQKFTNIRLREKSKSSQSVGADFLFCLSMLCRP